MNTSAAAIFILSFALIRPALADDFPKELVPELLAVEHDICRASTAYGRHFVIRRDIDGDGRADVILDYSDVVCGGVPGFFCRTGGCLLRVYGSRKGWHRLYDGEAGRWQVIDSHGTAELTVNGSRLLSH